MPIFYTDSGSFNILEVTGSTILSGSLIVSGATNFGPSGLTGSLFGTASNATSASFATNAQLLSNIPSTAFASTGSNVFNGTQTITGSLLLTTDIVVFSGSLTTSGSFAVSGSLGVTNGITGSLFGSASYADSASYALTASYAANGGGTSTPAFPFSGSAVITGSLLVSSSTTTPAIRTTGSINVLSGSITSSGPFNGIRISSSPTSNGFTIQDDLAGSLIMNTEGPFIRLRSSGAGIYFNGASWSPENPNDNPKDLGETGYNWRRLVVTQITASLVSASSYTSSLNNQVGFLGTSSFAVSSSQAISASFAQTAVTASYFSGSVSFPDGLTVGQLTASNAQLTNIVDTTATNKILVLNTANNQIFTTASVGGGGSGTGFPFSGSAVITGSLLVSGSTPNALRVESTASVESLLISGANQGGIIRFASNLLSDPIISTNGADLTINATGVVSLKGAVSADSDGFASFGAIIGDVTSVGVSSGGPYNLGGINAPWNKLYVTSVSASSYTSSLNNQVGFLGTSSFAVSSSYATSASYVASASFDGYINFANGLVVTGSITASAVSASFLTSSHVQLKGVSDTTSANKVLVLDTTTNKIFTTASVGGGGSGTGFPFNGSAVITGSLLVSSSVANPVTITGSINDFFELEIVNANAGNAASADIVASNDATTDFGNYIDMGINSTTYAGALVGGPSDGYLYFTSSVGELHVGNASTGGTSNVRLFAGGPSSDNTTRVFISSSGNVGIGTTTNLLNRLTVQGSVSASSVTGSFTGSFTGALTHFNPSTLKLTVGTTAPTSPAVNDLWVDTN